MRRLVFSLIACLSVSAINAQYYYQDIVGLKSTSRNFLKLKANNIKTVDAVSIEPDGSETESFGIKQEVDSKNNSVTTHSHSDMTGGSTLTTWYNADGKPKRFIDSSASSVNEVNYTYDKLGNLLLLASVSHEPGDSQYIIREDHVYNYDAGGKLVGLFRIKNKVDTTIVLFKLEKNGQPGEEEWWYKGFKRQNWFYYYDDHGNLTDIARFNEVAQKTLPDYIFAYDEDGDMTQQTVVMPSTNFYRVWIYEYLDNGLKKAESILKKGKEQEGRIVYSYE